MNKLLLIAKREVKNLINRKSFTISTAVICLLIMAGGAAYGMFSSAFNNDEETLVMVTPQTQQAVTLLQNSPDPVKVVALPADADPLTVAKQGYKGEKPEYVLDNSTGRLRLISNGRPSDTSLQQANNLAQQLALLQVAKEHQLDGSTLLQKLNTAAVEVEDVSGDNGLFSASFDPAAYLRGTGVTILIFFAIIFGANSLAMGVVQEKSSRVVEVLLAAVKPRQLLFGKVLGIVAINILQLACYLVSLLVALLLAGKGKIYSGFLDWSLLWAIPWLLIGILTYALVFAAFSSLASRQEDLSTSIAPLTLFAVLGFYLGIYLVPALPEAAVTKILSWIPGLSPFMMPLRAAFGAAWWEQLGALVVTLACLPLLARLAGFIYQRSILQVGSRLKLISVLRRR